MKTSELIGPALDWAVREALLKTVLQPELGLLIHQVGYGLPAEPYSTDWAQGGPIIEREEIDVYCYESPKSGCGWWVAEITGTKAKARGNSYLVAAMRCYTSSKLGDEIEIPEELK
jgi:hypothetical protein